jgi:MFS-type transporter involved in bile tolerance (Atg22 family)
MLKLRLFKIPTFSAAAVITFLIYGGLGVFMYFLPLNLVQNQGYSSLQAGIAVLPFGGIIAVMAPLTGKWADKKGSRLPLIIGPLLTGMAFIGFTFFEQTAGWADFATTFLPFLALAGIGMGMTVVPVTSAIMGCVEENDSGAASGISNAMSRLSGVIALSIVGMATLWFFENFVLQSISDMTIESSEREILMDEIAKFSGAQTDELSSDIRPRIEQAFTKGFFAAFDRSCYTAAGLCWIGSILTFFFIPKKNQ